MRISGRPFTELMSFSFKSIGAPSAALIRFPDFRVVLAFWPLAVENSPISQSLVRFLLGGFMGQARRIVIPGIPHHVVLHGVRSIDIFASDADRRYYVGTLNECAGRYGLSIWVWCLMTNHIHLVVVPADELSLGKGIGETHRRYSRHFNFSQSASGHLFKERYFSYPIQQDGNLLCVARYVELNPVMAGMVPRPDAYAWSSARHHLRGKADPLVGRSALLDMAPNWKEFLADGISLHRDREMIERHLSTGRPLGSPAWIAGLESKTGRRLAPRRVRRRKAALELR